MSSFQKRKSTPLLPGAKQSVYSGQQILSSGNFALDHIFGGGLPIGSILLIEEDKHGRYADSLSKFFLSEGCVHNHALFVTNLDVEPTEILRKLPLSVIDGKKSDNVQPTNKHQDDMRIAWRYNNLDKIDSEQGNQNNNYYFDSSKHIPEEKITTLDTTICNGVDENNSFNENIRFTNQNYASILEQLKKKLQKDKFKWSNDGEKNVLRILIQSLGSPLWWNDKFSSDLCLFLLILKSIVKHSSAVCCITVPSHLFQHFDQTLIHRVRNLVDYSIELESFAGSDREASAAFKEYHGLVYIRKLAAVNALAAHSPETYDLAFKLRRKKFIIEKLHLPPELQESEQREQDDNESILSAMSCGSNNKHLLEF